MSTIRKVLVANRGEIALRVFRSLKECGIRTVAVYSEADRLSPHVRYADQCVCIGPAHATESYLRQENIINAALSTGADAIHPGYGFLSENPAFAQAVVDAGLIFIGPTPAAIRTMGSKLEAKRAAAAFGVPLVPGTSEPVHDPLEAQRIATAIGFPVLIKASAGGGGKGMRIVHTQEEFFPQLERARSEAKAAFGDDSVFIEKYVSSPRHIEFQVIGDSHGNIIHLHERECSIQRRHQKVIEEAPSSVLSPEARAAMGEAAVNAARSCNYQNAGTVEFILDADNQFYFLEMNTRLQVEHPVTEMICGVDLVKLQLLVAEGKPLPVSQEEVRIRGHAIEARVYAEDPLRNFMPDTGVLKIYQPPGGPGVRVDNGYEQGMTVPVYYDPMLAKLICHAATREEAIEKMIRAIDDFHITGVSTTLPFCRFAVDHPAFRSGRFDTHFVEKHYRPELLSAAAMEGPEQLMAVAIAAREQLRTSPVIRSGAVSNGSKWRKNRTHG